jgi:PKD repeat protein
MRNSNKILVTLYLVLFSLEMSYSQGIQLYLDGYTTNAKLITSEPTVGIYRPLVGSNILTVVFGDYFLDQDIVGTNYTMNLICSSTHTRDFSAEIRIGGEQVASATFTVSGSADSLYTVNIEGINPQITGNEEVELSVTINGSGSALSTLTWGHTNSPYSHIVIPGLGGIYANFKANPTSGVVPLTVDFTDQSIGQIDTWSWDFGDGNTSDEQNPTHTYREVGSYTVVLDVSGSEGSDRETKSNYITVRKASPYREIVQDPANDALQSRPRDVYAGCDLDQDGKKEILLTDYSDGGKVHVYEFIANNTIELVWSSNGTASTYATPARSVKVGDLDGNGREEILLPIGRYDNSTEHGLYVFEWDGVDNSYGNGEPISVYPVVGSWTTGSTETIAVDDLDNDGKQEVVYVNNGSGNEDGVFIFSCTGEFSQGNISWVKEAVFSRENGDFPYSPYSTAIGDIDGDGNKDEVIGIWDDGAFLIIESMGTDQYVKRAYFQTTPGTDDICLKNIIITDFDKVGSDDIVFNLLTQKKIGVVHNISSWAELDTNAQITFMFSNLNAGFGMAYNDQDNDGEKNLFLTQDDAGRFVDVEYQGSGDRLSALNYEVIEAFVDITGKSDGSFAISAPDTDLDGDGLKEIVVTFIEGNDDPNKVWFRVFESIDEVNFVSEWTIVTPDNYVLYQNYPNPFNGETTIKFELPAIKAISLSIFDITGRMTKNLLLDKEMMPGIHAILWDGTNNSGYRVASGVYIYMLKFGNYSISKRMSFIK